MAARRGAGGELELSEDQVLWFRARRTHLAGPGAPNAAAAARAILGAQAQQLQPSLLGLSARTKGRPGSEALKRQLFGGRRALVRTWGQRETLHVYDPKAHWALVTAALERWAPAGRRGPMPTDALLAKALRAVEQAGRPVTRSDLLGVAPKSYERSIAPFAEAAAMPPERFAAWRLIWKLARRGDLCLGEDVARERSYPMRNAWFPDLPWEPPAPDEAAAALARHYLASHGPAAPTDVAHFFGARVGEAQLWVEALESELVRVACGARKGLVALRKDAAALADSPPQKAADWPVRLLPLWDCAMMAHKDKRWLLPASDEKAVWRKGAYVAATVIARGRVVATWAHKERAKAVDIEVLPLSGWRASHLAGVKREARAVAAHLGHAEANVRVTS